MKQTVGTEDPNLVEVRQPIHRRNKMARSHTTLPINGNATQEMSLAAAIHDHISCTKVISSPPALCHTDHIYANSGEISRKKRKGGKPRKNSAAVLLLRAAAIKHRHNRPKVLSLENKRLREMVVVQLELIRHLQEDSVVKDRQIMSTRQENETLRARLQRREHHLDTKKKKFQKSDEESLGNISETDSQPAPVVQPIPPPNETQNTHGTAVNLVTRYFGRRSKTVPSRALKRRYLGPPKTLPVKKSPTRVSSISSASEASQEPATSSLKPLVPDNVPIITNASVEEKCHKKKKKGEKSKNVSRKDNYLTTEKAYFLPDTNATVNILPAPETLIDVPSWKWKPIHSFYQMEGTENINDCVFQRRHLKCEQDERRRKRWDMQRLREQKASEKLKEKAARESNRRRNKAFSFYPDPKHIDIIEVTDQLPVLAFGHLIPLFQPSEFSMPWENSDSSVASPSSSRRKD
ncbi:male-specific lethal 1 homolog [Uloborus diversus]|uniref:male-specific lethal 1 homolog n=1 Tax=Uloborus diversus TaxID=327109 RepID=UPI00240A4187|nr:male-specific lethal 1 homolog [Uloborus diversus]